MVTGVGLTHFACIVKLAAWKPSIWCRNLGAISYTSWVKHRFPIEI